MSYFLWRKKEPGRHPRGLNVRRSALGALNGNPIITALEDDDRGRRRLEIPRFLAGQTEMEIREKKEPLIFSLNAKDGPSFSQRVNMKRIHIHLGYIVLTLMAIRVGKIVFGGKVDVPRWSQLLFHTARKKKEMEWSVWGADPVICARIQDKNM